MILIGLLLLIVVAFLYGFLYTKNTSLKSETKLNSPCQFCSIDDCKKESED